MSVFYRIVFCFSTSILLLFNSCINLDITGQYVFCPWNCHTLIINEDSTYTIEMRPEIGSPFEINGKWTQSENCITLKPVIPSHLHYDSIGSYWYVLLDTLKLQPDLTIFEIEETQYLFDKNKLVEKSTNISFFKTKSDSICDKKTVERSRKHALKPRKKS